MGNDNEYYWQVESKVYGGKGYSTATREEYTAVAKALDEVAGEFEKLATVWNATREQLDNRHAFISACTTHNSSMLPYTVLKVRCQNHADTCRQISDDLARTSQLLLKVLGVYSETELSVKRLFNEAVQFGTTANWLGMTMGMGSLALGGLLFGLVKEGKLNPSWMSTATSPFQEGYMSGTGAILSKLSPLTGLSATDEVNQGAGILSLLSAPLKNAAQGNYLNVREVTTEADVVRSSQTVTGAFDGLYRLANERLGKVDLKSGLGYATIAIQRYEKEDGESAWLVTVPGTDGQADSPFDWEQNAELMSADPEQRRQADSVRLVIEAMRQAGIGEDDEVAIVGHSQGGIVAASIASDWQDEFNVKHIVTAGSPIANHPVPEGTWVTSVEIEDELVAALDGASNPATPNWLTISGSVSQAPQGTESVINPDGSCNPGSTPITGVTPYDATPVAGGATSGKEISHWLQYHQAAYQDSLNQGNPAVQRHEAHFQNVIKGELKDTRYFEGRMSNEPLEPTISLESGTEPTKDNKIILKFED
ncbi:alpha/beta hydrolase [Bifidobacterium miconisargentati]|uniref:PGAP1-like alpha/beta domain-containing protein n=1 Tax=Bifidobacterium miconisargentati TaxID=2834437 RepID=UPI003B839AF0